MDILHGPLSLSLSLSRSLSFFPSFYLCLSSWKTLNLFWVEDKRSRTFVAHSNFNEWRWPPRSHYGHFYIYIYVYIFLLCFHPLYSSSDSEPSPWYNWPVMIIIDYAVTTTLPYSAHLATPQRRCRRTFRQRHGNAMKACFRSSYRWKHNDIMKFSKIY